MFRLILLFILTATFARAQLMDTVNVSSRWIKITKDSSHADLFCLDSTQAVNLDFVHVLKKWVEADQLNLYREETTENGGLKWRYIDYLGDFISVEKDSLNLGEYRPYFKRYGPESDEPLTDEWGEPMVRVGKDGFEEYVYPERDIFDLFTRHVDEIRIKETLGEVDENGNQDFEVSDVGFYFHENKYDRPKQLFWVNMKELLEVVQPKAYTWLSALLKRDYRGFQYKQSSQADGIMNYYESKHPKVLKISDSCSYTIPYNWLGYRQEMVIRFPENCPDSVNVYLEFYNSNFSYVHMVWKGSDKKLIGNWKENQELQLTYRTFYKEEKGTFLNLARACHTRKMEFYITVE